MWADQVIDFVIRSLEQENHGALRDFDNRRDTRAIVEELCDQGEFLHNTGVIPDEIVREKKECLFRQHWTQVGVDPTNIIALLFFQLAVEYRRTATEASGSAVPINSAHLPGVDPECPCEEKGVNAIPVRALKQRHFQEDNSSLVTSTLLFFPNATHEFNEEHISAELSKAQQARWQCRYDEVRKILARLHQELSGFSSASARYWKTKQLDLEVELTFTISQRPRSALVLEKSETAIRHWRDLHDPVALTHAFLRESVVYRQRFTESQAKGCQVDRYIHESLGSLYEAHDETLPQLQRLRTLDARSTMFSLYNDLAKASSHARQFDAAMGYFREAHAICHELEERENRRSLDLLITEGTFIREFFFEKGIFGQVQDLQKLAESIERAVALPLGSEDLVLRELLLKSYIPVLVGTNRRDEAEEVFRQCECRARQNRLHNQQRDLTYLGRALKLKVCTL